MLGAHRCGDKVTKTQRYQLAERLSPQDRAAAAADRHAASGNADQFAHFLRLLDADQFIDLERDKKLIQLEDNPWYLRRMKEDLRDFDGQRLFTSATR